MRAIVVPASKHGAALDVAEAIAVELRYQGLDADVWRPRDVRSLATADAVIVGSGIYDGRWLPLARDFLARHAEALRRMPVWLYSVGPVGRPLRPAGRAPEGEALAASVHAAGHRTFAGRIDEGDLDPRECAAAAALKAPQGDYRDWDSIRAWARTIAQALLQRARGETEVASRRDLRAR